MKYTYYALMLLLVSSAGALADDAKKETTTNNYDAAKFTGYSALTLSEVGTFLYGLKESWYDLTTESPIDNWTKFYALLVLAFQAKNDALAAHNYFQKTFPEKNKIESSSSDNTKKTTAPSSKKADVAELTGYSVFGAINIVTGPLIGFGLARNFRFRNAMDWCLAVLAQAAFRLGINNLYSAKDHFKKAFTADNENEKDPAEVSV